MLRGSGISGVRTSILGALLLAYPCGVLAQHGGGGRGTGGDTGTPMGVGGRATGLSVGDDLKNFHAALAVQATSQQTIEYAAMLKSTAVASAELQTFLEQLGKANGAELASHNASLDQSIEKARAANRKFLEGFSEPQKSGLKEVMKKLIKADADLAQQVKALDLEVGDTKAMGPQIASSGQSLEHALTSFRSQQLDLGEEMSVGAGSNGEASGFSLPTVRNSVSFENQTVRVITSGVIAKGVAEGGQNLFRLELTADLSDLQQNMTDVLRAELEKSDRCGERITIHSATLTPRAPASLVVVQLHFERWVCGTTFGRETTNEIVEGNGTIEVTLTPAVAEDGTLRLVAGTGRVEAQGLVGELLRSGSLGDALRSKLTESLLSAMRQGSDFKALLPSAAQGNATLRRAQFQGTGSGRLLAVLDGEIRVSNEKATALTSELQGRSPSQGSPQEPTQESVPR